MSSVTRIGFTVPAVTDFADEIVYHNNNISIYEAELPSLIVSSLPASGNYAGRVRVLNNPQTTNPPAPAMPYTEYVYNGSAWVRLSAAGLRSQIIKGNPTDSNQISSSGSEVFSSVLPGYSQLTVQNGSIIKFMCQVHLGAYSDFGFNGKFNIFVNPNSSNQPNPSTPGAIRLSFPIVESDDVYTNGVTDGGLDYFYGELLYASSYSGAIGVGAYLSSTYTHSNSYIHDPSVDTSEGPQIPTSGIQILNEIAGTWSG